MNLITKKMLNPKHNPQVRRKAMSATQTQSAAEKCTLRIPYLQLVNQRDALGRPIANKIRRFWGGRLISKYDPVAEDRKHGRI